MTVYKAPLRDFRFVLDELLDVSTLASSPATRRRPPEIFAAVLEEGGKLCEEVLFPLNRSGDEEGCTYENGVVHTPKGFKEAYTIFREAAGRRSLRSAYGGQGLPHTLNVCRRGDDLLVPTCRSACIQASPAAPTAPSPCTARTRSRHVICRISSTAPGRERCA